MGGMMPRSPKSPTPGMAEPRSDVAGAGDTIASANNPDQDASASLTLQVPSVPPTKPKRKRPLTARDIRWFQSERSRQSPGKPAYARKGDD